MADERPGGHEGRDAGENSEGPPVEETLERMLTEFGPLLRRRLEAGVPDAAFVERLRARLLSDEAAMPAQDAVTAPDAMAGRPGAPAAEVASRRARGVLARRRGVVAALAAALVVALLVVLVVLGRVHHPASVVAWQPPMPSVADLTRGFPALPRALATVARDPTVSLAAAPRGHSYAGRIALSKASLPTRVFRLLAFRLADPAVVASPQRVTLLARRLGLHARSRRIVRGHTAWMVVAEGGPPTHRSLHSIAVSTAGELVYHDAFTDATIRREVWRDNPFAVAAARGWLSRLGWPGARMPLIAVEHSGLPIGVRAIEFGWVGAGPVATAAATLWITPAGHVVEADVWPPTESVRTIVARSLAAAWTAVHGGLVPLAVESVLATIGAPGVGVMRHVTVTQVLSTGSDQRLYLVPTYRFAGVAHLRGIRGARPCYALAPAGQA